MGFRVDGVGIAILSEGFRVRGLKVYGSVQGIGFQNDRFKVKDVCIRV